MSTVSFFRDWVDRAARRVRSGPPQRELNRLSPHVLRDIGFESRRPRFAGHREEAGVPPFGRP